MDKEYREKAYKEIIVLAQVPYSSGALNTFCHAMDGSCRWIDTELSKCKLFQSFSSGHLCKSKDGLYYKCETCLKACKSNIPSAG